MKHDKISKFWLNEIRKISAVKMVSEVDLPISSTIDTIEENGHSLTRLRIVLLTNGCKVKTCTMCSLPCEAAKDNIKEEDIINQLKGVLKNHKKFDNITLYTNGNLFFDAELSETGRMSIYEEIAKTDAKTLVVETLPGFVTEEKLTNAQRLLGKVKLEIAVGLQCWDNATRRITVNSICTSRDFINAAKLINSFGYKIRVFILYGLPFLSMEESVWEIQNTLTHLRKIDNIAAVIICPLKVSKNTLIEKAAKIKNNSISTPSLWQVHDLAKSLEVYPLRLIISTSLLNYEGSMVSCSCCREDVINSLNNFNMGKGCLEVSRCSCAGEILAPIKPNLIKAENLIKDIFI